MSFCVKAQWKTSNPKLSPRDLNLLLSPNLHPFVRLLLDLPGGDPPERGVGAGRDDEDEDDGDEAEDRRTAHRGYIAFRRTSRQLTGRRCRGEHGRRSKEQRMAETAPLKAFWQPG
ncbi:MAG TPA: hypothetical protein VFC56_15975 [Stellaceae bacterium]|nr:hypothetical protein [Stellaceae bacterium]